MGERDIGEFLHLLDNKHLEAEDLRGIDRYIYKRIVRKNAYPYNAHNLRVLFLTFTDEKYRRSFFNNLSVLEVELTRLIVGYYDILLYKARLDRYLRTAFHENETDVVDVLFEALYPYLNETDLSILLNSTIERTHLFLFHKTLCYIEKYRSEKGGTKIVNNNALQRVLARSPVEYFDNLYLLGFNVYKTYNGVTFAQEALYCRNIPILVRLFHLNVITDGDLYIDYYLYGRRSYYHFLLTLNQEINDSRGDLEKDTFLRRYIPLQKVPLSVARALSREFHINNRIRTSKKYTAHTGDFLASIRPETNRELAVALRRERTLRRKNRLC